MLQSYYDDHVRRRVGLLRAQYTMELQRGAISSSQMLRDRLSGQLLFDEVSTSELLNSYDRLSGGVTQLLDDIDLALEKLGDPQLSGLVAALARNPAEKTALIVLVNVRV